MMYASILTFVVAAYWVAAAPGDLSYVQWFEIEPASEIHAKIVGESWELFKTKHNKQYGSTEEEAYRRSVFAENMKKIEIHNQKYKKGEKSYWLGVNQFSDLKAEEFKKLHSGCVKMRVNLTDATCSTFLPPHNVVLPDAVDWRDKGYVTPVKNQKDCGSCWSFSATGSLEGQNFQKTGKLISLSEQQLVDCSGDFGNHGCEGGLMDQAFEYIKKYGIETEEVYPYKAKDQKCKFSSSKIVAKDTGCVDIESGSESALQQAIASIGPISVAIDASHPSFQSYSGGVYVEKECSSTDLDHGVLAVGYGRENGIDYWLVKNSWGEQWGEHGYIKMARNMTNMCGIATAASYPLV
ncbi:hypothetical protein CHS0354_010230 [Potamilus streckersoni]|uniref:Cathepsin L n=1 Tax=Potamilus streckersoni TaxID=2493646 RepID=A0AAE0RSN6_9BIVA|nr:hypothetical protein CHS0354_010230 [Potamilus streckersoni]